MPRLKGPTHQARVLGRAHNAIGEEAKRIRTDHTGEPDVVLDNRVLGTLAVTRGQCTHLHTMLLLELTMRPAIGDHILKLPVVYTHKVFGNVEGGMRALGPVLARIRTPPYVSARAHVEHAVPPDGAILVLASDGLQGLQHGRLDPQAWVASAVRPATHHERAAGWEHGGARALVVLRDALGGADGARVSAMMTAEMMDKWCDDVTVVVQRLCDE
jgi:pyruvate dehydrogenase phosphatase